MGPIREPKHVDFYVEDRPLTEEETRLLKEAIAKNKAAARTGRTRTSRPRLKRKTKVSAKR